MTTSNMKRSSAVLRLKENYNKLASEDNAHNLRVFFGCIDSVNIITLSDFSYILTGLNTACSTTETPPQNKVTEPDQQMTVQTGEHVASVWADENDATGRTLTWHIEVVEDVDDGGATVSYLVQTNNNN